MQALSSLFTPEVGGMLNFGMNILGSASRKSATAIESWRKWEADSIRAIRQSTATNKANYRAYQVDMTNWLSKSKYTSELRQYENQLATDRAQLKTETSINATEALGKKYADLDARYYEEEASDTIKLESLRTKAIADGVKVIASGQAGRSIERISNTYHQQWLQNAGNRQITRNFRLGDKLSAMQAANADAMNKTNSVTLYNPRPYNDPVQPLAPMPAETYLPNQPKVSGSLSLLDVAGAAMGAYNTYMEMRPPDMGDGGGNESQDESGGDEGDEGGGEE